MTCLISLKGFSSAAAVAVLASAATLAGGAAIAEEYAGKTIEIVLMPAIAAARM